MRKDDESAADRPARWPAVWPLAVVGWWPPKLGGALWGVTLLLACAVSAGLAGRQWWVFDLASHFQVQYLAVATLLLVASLVLRAWRPASAYRAPG